MRLMVEFEMISLNGVEIGCFFVQCYHCLYTWPNPYISQARASCDCLCGGWCEPRVYHPGYCECARGWYHEAENRPDASRGPAD